MEVKLIKREQPQKISLKEYQEKIVPHGEKLKKELINSIEAYFDDLVEQGKYATLKEGTNPEDPANNKLTPDDWVDILDTTKCQEIDEELDELANFFYDFVRDHGVELDDEDIDCTGPYCKKVPECSCPICKSRNS